MKILPLTRALEARLLAGRVRRDADAERTAAVILADVKRRGDRAVAAWSRKLDGPRRVPLAVSRAEWAAARAATSHAFRRAVTKAAANVRAVARMQLPKTWSIEVEPGVTVGQRVVPLASVGCYVPGGRYPLVSSVIMAVVPAQVAGVKRIAVACPQPNAEMLWALDALGVHEVYRVGGAQAIGALAYGTRTIRPVDKIVGPGNRWVAAAKRLVSTTTPIDMLAGPTEVLVLSDGGRPDFIAADLLAQAEHDPDAVALLVTTSRRLAERVARAIDDQLAVLPKTSPVRLAINGRSAIIVARSRAAAAGFADRFAAEHLSLPDGDREPAPAAGSIFVGPWSAQPLGDFVTGSNHTLPTSGAARARGGLSAADFVRCVSVQRVSRAGFARLAPAALELARAEGLPAHARAVEIRA